MTKYGKAAVESGSCEALSAAEVLGDCECDVSEVNNAIQEGVVPHEGPGGAPSMIRMTAYRPLVTYSKKGTVTAWGVGSELRLSRQTKGYIVQHVCDRAPITLWGREDGGMSIHQCLEGFPSGENDAHSGKGQVCSGLDCERSDKGGQQALPDEGLLCIGCQHRSRVGEEEGRCGLEPWACAAPCSR
jgi:hypothetical protein